MKKLIFLTLVVVLCVSEVYSQTPVIPYQAVLLNKEAGQELPGSDAKYANPLRNTLVSTGLDMKNLYSGFSVQNVQSAIPEAVGSDNKGFLTLSDRPIIAASVNAIKELNAKNEA